jgi:hypothetical protein
LGDGRIDDRQGTLMGQLGKGFGMIGHPITSISFGL